VKTSSGNATRPADNHQTYSFGQFVLDVDRGALLKEGQDVPLRPKSFEVLRYLIEHHGILVTKDQLLDSVWAEVVVTEGSLNQCLIEIRNVLGDDSREMVRTVPRRGYLFDVQVTVHRRDEVPVAQATPNELMSNRRPSRWSVGAAIILALAIAATWWNAAQQNNEVGDPEVVSDAASPTSIAVLPFADMSPGGDQEYFGDGISEEILNLLAQTPELTVIARTSSFSFKNQPVDIGAIARKLNVANVLEGSVRKDGNLIRVTAQLVSAANGAHLWSNTYDYPLEDVFALQTHIATAVTDALKIKLLTTIPVPRETDPEVYSLYLQGNYFIKRRDVESLEKALAAFQQALAIDPDYAPAWNGLSITYSFQTTAGVRSQELGFALSREAAERALALDINMAAAWSSIAYLRRTVDMDWAGAQAAIDRALQLEPNNVNVLGMAASLANTLGRFSEGTALLERAATLDPLNLSTLRSLGRIYTKTGRYDQAIETISRLLAMHPEDPGGHIRLGRVYLLKGDPERALIETEKNRDSKYYTVTMARIHFTLGNEAQSQAFIRESIATYANELPGPIATVYAWRGENDLAFEWFEKALEQQDWRIGTALGNEWNRNLEDDPRYPVLLAKYGLLDAWKAMSPEYGGHSESPSLNDQEEL
jgi:TolB-like protein/DNA-binding winged helix-turn-helix (wHTH) protein/Tfp pilus assembly protein PilF